MIFPIQEIPMYAISKQYLVNSITCPPLPASAPDTYTELPSGETTIPEVKVAKFKTGYNLKQALKGKR